jgi:hypothetical protein
MELRRTQLQTDRRRRMSTPQRIQLRRTKGWRKPEGAIVVARPSKWGNPFKVRREMRTAIYAVEVDAGLIQQRYVWDDPWALAVDLYRGLMLGWSPSELADYANHELAYAAHLAWLNRLGRGGHPIDHARFELKGHDLACWCPLDQPCHADVLLELANQ